MEYTYQYITDPYTNQISTETIKRLPDNAFIPNDPDNVDWQQYQVWLLDGNQPLPPAGAK
jgi:hypothetical protein